MLHPTQGLVSPEFPAERGQLIGHLPEVVTNNYPYQIYDTVGQIADPELNLLAAEAALRVAQERGMPVIGNHNHTNRAAGDHTYDVVVLTESPDADVQAREGSFISYVATGVAIHFNNHSEYVRHQDDAGRYAAAESAARAWAELWDIQNDPAAYYPWLVSKAEDFYSRLYDQGAGDRGQAGEDLGELYHTVRAFLERLPIGFEATQGFDYLKNGDLVRLLAMGLRDIEDPELQHGYGVISQDGRQFLHSIIDFMPAVVAKQVQRRLLLTGTQGLMVIDYIDSRRQDHRKARAQDLQTVATSPNILPPRIHQPRRPASRLLAALGVHR